MNICLHPMQRTLDGRKEPTLTQVCMRVKNSCGKINNNIMTKLFKILPITNLMGLKMKFSLMIILDSIMKCLIPLQK